MEEEADVTPIRHALRQSTPIRLANAKDSQLRTAPYQSTRTVPDMEEEADVTPIPHALRQGVSVDQHHEAQDHTATDSGVGMSTAWRGAWQDLTGPDADIRRFLEVLKNDEIQRLATAKQLAMEANRVRSEDLNAHFLVTNIRHEHAPRYYGVHMTYFAKARYARGSRGF
eukprot:CAMPEP_0171078098 /NCGR_PEP_ID=MMETSP0766_2-20121228/14442_1 /TAXON_ID=439317 /ORGANISM="Gambierdiscus australes, Strain CAWD 149" /LENGTH=169 /DNA_ID=CAMNT_0011535203 /DNA_START=1 /DNA_END=507 /DNA_ORIENTATION=-